MKNKRRNKNVGMDAPLAEKPHRSSNFIVSAAAFLVAVIAFAVFMPALGGEFLYWDDNLLISENKNIQSISWVFSDAVSNPAILGWYPLTVASLYVDHFFWGLNPFGYHLTNNTLHSLNSFLVFITIFWLVRLGIGEKAEALRISLASAFVTSVLFAVHPLRVESVAWITERKDVLYAFFFLLSILCYLKYASGTERRLFYYWGSLILFAMSLMSKSMAVTMPIVMLILDYFPLRRLFLGETRSDLKKVLLEKAPFFLLSIIISIFTLLQHHEAGTLSIVETQPFIVRILVSIRGYSFYLYKFIMPFGLVPWYPYPKNINPFSPEYSIPIILFVSFTAACILLIKKRRLFPAAWFYYLITLLPIIGITQTAGFSAANRYTYLPSLGPFMLAGVFAGVLFTRADKARRILLAALFLAATGLLVNITFKNILIWNESIRLWSYQIDAYPDSDGITYLYRGIAFRKKGKYEEALKDYNKAIEMRPSYFYAYNNRAVAYEYLGKNEEALRDYNNALALDPEYANAYFNRADFYEKRGELELALSDYTKAIDLKPGFARAYGNRARVKEALGRYDEAADDYRRSLKLDSFAPDVYFRLGSLYLNLGRFADAAEAFGKAVDINPKFIEAYGNRGTAYLNLGRRQEAIEDFGRVIGLAPDSAMAYINRGLAYAETGKAKEALNNYNMALKIEPSNAAAHYEKGKIYVSMNEREKAFENFKTAYELGDERAAAYLK
ncbi:MAG: tetratricopeptide repeat protein [Nitrospirae bacterium]|nr:tetratricopeptide repeat protein [Nitrospirota bacterium]